MAYQLVSTPSTQEAVMTAVRDFAVANGWTNENYTASNPGVSRGVMTLSRGDCYVSFRWEGTESEATKSIAMYQSLGYDAPNAATPWNFTDDSGNGTTSATSLTANRRVADIGSGPYVALHLFASDTDAKSGNSAPHVYCVLEYAPGKYRHFAFGNIDKFGDWTGGEFVAGHEWSDTSVDESNPTSANHTVLLDAFHNDSDGDAATIHMEGLPGQNAASKWGQVGNDNSPANDRAGNPRDRVQGGCRGSLYTYVFGRFVPSALTGFFSNMPIPVWYRRDSSGSNRRVYLLGHMPNVRMVQLRNLSPGEEITIGSLTYKVFPVTAKSDLGGSVEESENMGIAYVKVA